MTGMPWPVVSAPTHQTPLRHRMHARRPCSDRLQISRHLTLISHSLACLAWLPQWVLTHWHSRHPASFSTQPSHCGGSQARSTSSMLARLQDLTTQVAPGVVARHTSPACSHALLLCLHAWCTILAYLSRSWAVTLRMQG